jgi:molecular chaperone GrpE
MNRTERGDDAVDRQDLPADQTHTPADGHEPLAADDLEPDDQGLELLQLREEAERNYESYQRAVADLANYRRRKEQEILRVAEQSRRAVLKQFLPVVDDFERALSSINGGAAASGWAEGFQLIERKLRSVLEAEGVRPMETLGQEFDPRLHEAVQVEEGVSQPDTVVAEFSKGYYVGDDVLRPAVVKVGARSQESES